MIANTVASFCACSSHSGATRHSSAARTRGGNRDASLARSISQSGCAYEPTSDVGRSVVGCPMAGHRTTLRSGPRLPRAGSSPGAGEACSSYFALMAGDEDLYQQQWNLRPRIDALRAEAKSLRDRNNAQYKTSETELGIERDR